jgi:TRAP-type uncharacterized transport system fused permease subunit
MSSYENDAASRVAAPAIALIITAIISIIGWIGWGGYNIATLPAQRRMFEQQQQQALQQQKNADPRQAQQVQQAMQMGMNVGIGMVVAFATIGVISNMLTLVGGLKMKGLQSHGLAMMASILAVIPCLSPCCLLGIPFGIWSLMVLSKPEVKAAFR